MVDAPQISLKVIVVSHLVLTVWASMMQEFLPPAYIYMNAFILAFGFWAIVAPDSVDSVLMFFIFTLSSMLMDVIFLGIFVPHSYHYYQTPEGAGRSQVNEYRFSLGMSIVNLLIKPFTSFILYRMYQSRGGSYSDFGIPGIPEFGVGGHQPHGYENIDQPVPSNSMDSGSPHHQPMDKSPLP